MSFICLLFVCSLLAFPVNTTCGAEMSHGLNKRLHKKKNERERKGKEATEGQTTYDYFQMKGVHLLYNLKTTGTLEKQSIYSYLMWTRLQHSIFAATGNGQSPVKSVWRGLWMNPYI